MKLHLTGAADKQLITGYGEGWVEINEVRFSASLIVMPDTVINDWGASSFDQLSAEHFARVGGLNPEVVLLGTGKTQRFIHPRLSRVLTEAGVGVECMDT